MGLSKRLILFEDCLTQVVQPVIVYGDSMVVKLSDVAVAKVQGETASRLIVAPVTRRWIEKRKPSAELRIQSPVKIRQQLF